MLNHSNIYEAPEILLAKKSERKFQTTYRFVAVEQQPHKFNRLFERLSNLTGVVIEQYFWKHDFDKSAGNHNWLDCSLDNSFNTRMVGWQSSNRRKSHVWRSHDCNIVWPIVYAVTLIIVGYFLGSLIGSTAYIIALLLVLIAWIWVYKASFRTGWLGGIAIAILAWIIFVVVSIIFGALFGVIVPGTFFPHI